MDSSNHAVEGGFSLRDYTHLVRIIGIFPVSAPAVPLSPALICVFRLSSIAVPYLPPLSGSLRGLVFDSLESDPTFGLSPSSPVFHKHTFLSPRSMFHGSRFTHKVPKKGISDRCLGLPLHDRACIREFCIFCLTVSTEYCTYFLEK